MIMSLPLELYDFVESELNAQLDLLRWNDDGTALKLDVSKREVFAQALRKNKDFGFKSLARSLNGWGFTVDKDEIRHSTDLFQRGRRDTVITIKRKSVGRQTPKTDLPSASVAAPAPAPAPAPAGPSPPPPLSSLYTTATSKKNKAMKQSVLPFKRKKVEAEGVYQHAKLPKHAYQAHHQQEGEEEEEDTAFSFFQGADITALEEFILGMDDPPGGACEDSWDAFLDPAAIAAESSPPAKPTHKVTNFQQILVRALKIHSENSFSVTESRFEFKNADVKLDEMASMMHAQHTNGDPFDGAIHETIPMLPDEEQGGYEIDPGVSIDLNIAQGPQPQDTSAQGQQLVETFAVPEPSDPEYTIQRRPVGCCTCMCTCGARPEFMPSYMKPDGSLNFSLN